MEYLFYDTIDSTNDEAKRLIRAGKVSCPVCLVADKQTSGRGRQGKSFFSPDTGLYMTVALPVNKEIASQVTMTVRTACAVAESIENVINIPVGIKWVNDIYLYGKKCCGILCEAVNDYEKGLMTHMIAGIGINLYTKEWPEDLKDTAVSLFEEGNEPKDMEAKKKELYEKISDGLWRWIFLEPAKKFYDFYVSHSIVLGKEIVYTENGINRTGKAVDISMDGGLVIEVHSPDLGNNSMPGRKILNSGEISVRSLS